MGDKVGQEQIHDLLFHEKLSWQAIIYDLINSEQLDPWDIDIALLSNKYLERIREIEEANFFISSKVLLAASLLLRIKSDVLLNKELASLEAILMGKKEEKKYVSERIDLDEDIPGLVPRTPLPRFRRVTLHELMSALRKAIVTENRRITKEIVKRQSEREMEVFIPKNVLDIRAKIRDIYVKIKDIFRSRENKLAFSELLEKSGENKIAAFVSLLHLDNQQKIWIEQEGHFEEIWILLKSIYEKQKKKEVDELIDEMEESAEHEVEIEEVTGFSDINSRE